MSNNNNIMQEKNLQQVSASQRIVKALVMVFTWLQGILERRLRQSDRR